MATSGRGRSRWAARIVLIALAAASVTGCTSPNVGRAGDFVFVSPGGLTEFTYPADTRQSIGDFTGTSVTDAETTLRLSDHPDTVVVLNVWASWCGPCRAEMPDLKVVSDLHRDEALRFLGLNVQDERQSAADFLAARDIDFPSIFDPTSRTLLSLRNFPTVALPNTIVLDRQHRVAHLYLRPVQVGELDAAVTALLAESP